MGLNITVLMAIVSQHANHCPAQAGGKRVNERSRLANQGWQQTKPMFVTPFIALGRPPRGASLSADHRAMNHRAARRGAAFFVT